MNSIYVSGPITGYEDYNKLAFDRVKTLLLQSGDYEKVITPFDVSTIQKNKSWESYMKDDIIALMGCDSICMLKNSENSIGAMTEYNLAFMLDYTIIYEEEL